MKKKDEERTALLEQIKKEIEEYADSQVEDDYEMVICGAISIINKYL